VAAAGSPAAEVLPAVLDVQLPMTAAAAAAAASTVGHAMDLLRLSLLWWCCNLQAGLTRRQTRNTRECDHK
jgi:hypothetical protein